MLHGNSGDPVQGGFPRPFGPKYMLLEHLATGGMADVFLARQSGPAGFAKECVIKRILPHLGRDPEFVHMFLDEAKLCARLNHPNVAQVYDLGQVGDDYYIAMEHVHGLDLERILQGAREKGEQRLPYTLAARVVAAVADGLEHAHNAADQAGHPLGIVHRDVTPSNIVVSFDGVPKLLDFGIAKATTHKGRTEVGVIKGKTPYMSPEQLAGHAIDGRSDLFSLGAILFELTTGSVCWTGENAAQIGMKIANDDPTPPSLLMGDYPEELEAIVMGALAKRTADRTPTARALQIQLEKFLVQSGAHVTAHEVSQYLAERFPVERKRLASISTTAQQTREALAMTERRKTLPSGPLSIGDPALIGDLPGDGEYQPGRRNLGGGKGWILPVILLLVAGTAAALYFLRGYEIKKEVRAETAAGEIADAGLAPAPEGVVPPATGAAPEAPKVTPLADSGQTKTEEAKPEEAKPEEAKPEATRPGPKKPAPKPHHNRPHKDEAPSSLPHLPTLAPTDNN
jgi:serine/threonine-protein kinase